MMDILWTFKLWRVLFIWIWRKSCRVAATVYQRIRQFWKKCVVRIEREKNSLRIEQCVYFCENDF